MARFSTLLLVSLLTGCALMRPAPQGPAIDARVEVVGLLGKPRPVHSLTLELRDAGGARWQCAGTPTPLRCPPLPAGRYRPTALLLHLPEGTRRIPLADAGLSPAELDGGRLEARVHLGHRRLLAHRAHLRPAPDTRAPGP